MLPVTRDSVLDTASLQCVLRYERGVRIFSDAVAKGLVLFQPLDETKQIANATDLAADDLSLIDFAPMMLLQISRCI